MEAIGYRDNIDGLREADPKAEALDETYQRLGKEISTMESEREEFELFCKDCKYFSFDRKADVLYMYDEKISNKRYEQSLIGDRLAEMGFYYD